MNKDKTHIMYGLLIGIILVIFSLVLITTGLAFNTKTQWVAYIQYIPILAGLIMNAMAYAKANENYVTYGNVFWSCFRACMVIAIVSVTWCIIEINFMPEVKTKALQMTTESLQKKNMPEEQIDQSLEYFKKFYAMIMVLGVVFGTLLVGAICSAIAAAIPKKKGAKPFQMQ